MFVASTKYSVVGFVTSRQHFDSILVWADSYGLGCGLANP